MQRPVRAAAILVCFFALIAPLPAQHRVDPRNMYERVLCVVPMTGVGTFDDPKRPMFTPAPSALSASAVSRNGILAFSYVVSDDGLLALVEFVARDKSAFQEILTAPTVKFFVKGKDTRADIESEFKKYKKNFDFTHFGTRMP
jgi:hypothetical protein